MEERSLDQSLQDYLDERANQPFGDVEGASDRTLQPFSIAGRTAAGNLLDKAHRALDEDDVDLARAMVDRAVRLSFDRHEMVAPAAFAVHMDLFCSVTDALEESAPDDSTWLDAAVAVLTSADPMAACDLRDVLRAVDHDYDLNRLERQRIQAAIESVPERAELIDLGLTGAELHEHVWSILHAVRAYERAVG